MSFANAHHFNIENLSAVDRGDGGNVIKRLVQESCLAAGHRFKERFDSPKYHPETRRAVINNIMSWVDSEASEEHIMWMSGPAGAGKSAIAQTICGRCHEEKKLLASFFFSRTDIGAQRDDGNRLVPTITCQLATAIPETKVIITNVLENDLSVLSYSMNVQMEKLVLEPLSQVHTTMNQTKPFNVKEGRRLPYLVVIDGLDECKNHLMQSNIIEMIVAIFSGMNIRLRFLIASRPELDIRRSFLSPSVSTICARIDLNEKYKPDEDIHVYL